MCCITLFHRIRPPILIALREKIYPKWKHATLNKSDRGLSRSGRNTNLDETSVYRETDPVNCPGEAYKWYSGTLDAKIQSRSEKTLSSSTYRSKNQACETPTAKENASIAFAEHYSRWKYYLYTPFHYISYHSDISCVQNIGSPWRKCCKQSKKNKKISIVK